MAVLGPFITSILKHGPDLPDLTVFSAFLLQPH